MGGVNNFAVAVDNTDHISFVCPFCKTILYVNSVETNRMDYHQCKVVDKCTYISAHCPKCKEDYRRKFYWELHVKKKVHIPHRIDDHCDVVGLHDPKYLPLGDFSDRFNNVNKGE